MTRKNQHMGIEIGQLWRDDQRGQEGRTVRVVDKPSDLDPKVTIVVVTPVTGSWNGPKTIGRRNKVDPENLRRNYSLVTDVPNPENERHAQAADQLQRGLALAELVDMLDERTAEGLPTVLFTRRKPGEDWSCRIDPTLPGKIIQVFTGHGPRPGDALRAAMYEAGWL